MNVKVAFGANNPNIACFSSDHFEVLEDTSNGLGVVHFDKDGVTPLFMDRKARVFVAGFHKGQDYSEPVLDSYNAKFVEPKDDFRGWKVPLQADHQPRSCNNTIGHPRKMWREGKEEFAILRYVGKEAVEKAQLGLYGPLSVGIDLVEGKWEHIAHTPFPHFDNTEAFEKSEKKGDKTMDPKKEVTTPPTAELAEFTKMKEEFARQQEEFAKQLATMEAERAKLAKEVQFAKDKELIETFSRPNEKGHIRTTPGMKDEELALFHSLNDEQRKLFEAYKAKMPAFIDTNIYNTQQFSKPGEETDEDATAKAKRMAGKA